jgi:hypothetical protein
MDTQHMDPTVIELGARLAEVAGRNLSEAITTRIHAVKARKNDQQTINELEEIIQSLISDRNDLVLIARGYQ